jgi:DNA polymerase III subunit epsilon
MSPSKRRHPFPPPVPPVATPHSVRSPEQVPQPAERLVVIDTETTGLSNRDRIVEVAAVVFDTGGDVVDEYDTLVNPHQDVGPTHIHGITGPMVSQAPTFDEVAEALARRINGAVLVAHNLPFDVRFLANEYRRVGATLMPGKGICTLRLTGVRLEVACQRYGVPLDHHHRALADARAAGMLLQRLLGERPHGVPANVQHLAAPFSSRTLPRVPV